MPRISGARSCRSRTTNGRSAIFGAPQARRSPPARRYPCARMLPKRHGAPLGEGATPAMTGPVDASSYTMSRRTTKPRPDILIDDLDAAVNKMYPEVYQSRPDQPLVRQYQ